MDITAEMLENFKYDLKSAMKDFEKRYRITIDIGKISYDENSFRTKLTGIVDVDKEFNMLMEQKGAPFLKGKYGKNFIGTDGEKYTLIGVASSKKYFLKAKKISTEEIFRLNPAFIRSFI